MAGEMSKATGKGGKRDCIADKDCPMTAGYYIGGGRFICWLHAMKVRGMLEAVAGQQMVALPLKKVRAAVRP
jgi:hypothetical protein